MTDSQSGETKTILSKAPQESVAYTSISADNRVICFTIVEDNKGNICLASLK